MSRAILALLLLFAPGSAAAQLIPSPDRSDTRLQTIVWNDQDRIELTAFPEGVLNLVFHPGERVVALDAADPAMFAVAIASDGDGIIIQPLRPDARGEIGVTTDRRSYRFGVRTSTGLLAAYVVRFVENAPRQESPLETAPSIGSSPTDMGPITGLYRTYGDQTLKPARMGDDGVRTYIDWPADAPLPAVFGIGTNGDEEVVDGHMRDGLFTVDRVYPELVFRIDDKKLVARRRDAGGE